MFNIIPLDRSQDMFPGKKSKIPLKTRYYIHYVCTIPLPSTYYKTHLTVEQCKFTTIWNDLEPKYYTKACFYY